MAGKVRKRTWTSRGALGRKVRHTAYGYDITINGKRERTFSAEWTTPTAALEAMLARQKEAEAGLGPQANRTLGELAEEYLTYKTERGKRSIREDRRIVRKRLVSTFGDDLDVRRLTGPMIAQYERQRAGEVSAFTVANELTVLRHMLRLGERWGYVDKVPAIELPKKPEGRREYLEQAEIDQLLKACAFSKNPYLTTIITVALNTGMRKAEILGLEWDRVDLAGGRLTLYRTKSGKPRGVPMTRAVYDSLVALEPSQEARVGLVFKRRDGAAWGQVRTAFVGALKRASITGFRFHDLRHTFASHFIMRGGSLKALQEILGHADYKMTLRYSHLSPAHLRADMERMEGLTSHSSAQNGVNSLERLVSVHAPVAQVDRAAVS